MRRDDTREEDERGDDDGARRCRERDDEGLAFLLKTVGDASQRAPETVPLAAHEVDAAEARLRCEAEVRPGVGFVHDEVVEAQLSGEDERAIVREAPSLGGRLGFVVRGEEAVRERDERAQRRERGADATRARGEDAASTRRAAR